MKLDNFILGVSGGQVFAEMAERDILTLAARILTERAEHQFIVQPNETDGKAPQTYIGDPDYRYEYGTVTAANWEGDRVVVLNHPADVELWQAAQRVCKEAKIIK